MKRLVLLLVVAVLVALSLPAESYPQGLPRGGFPSGDAANGCNCHGAQPNASLAVTLEGLPESYAAGTDYRLWLNVSHDPVSRVAGPTHYGGFSLRASIGTFADDANLSVSGDGRRVSHSGVGTVLNRHQHWLLVWTAPASPREAVTFNYLVISTDGDSTSSGDAWTVGQASTIGEGSRSALHEADVPLLSTLLLLPLLGAAAICIGRRSPLLPRTVALGTSLVSLTVAVAVFLQASGGGYRLMEEYVWSEKLGISLLFGVDGISAPMVLLTGLLTPLAIIFAWNERRQPALFFALLLVMETALLGVFVSLDYFVFYLFWEVTLIPMFFLIAVWGGPRKRYASLKFFLYTFTASAVMLVGFMALYFEAGMESFSMIEIQAQSHRFSDGFQLWVFAALFLSFAVKMPMVPWHTWLPDAHVEAPTAGSVLLAGLMLKMGLYGLIRAALPVAPDGAEAFVPVMVAVAVASILYGALLSLGQTDLKKLVAYASISHMGVALLGVATLTELGIAGGVFMMFAHGLLSPAMFMVAGVLLHQVGTRNIPKLGGLAQKQPCTAALFVVVFLGSLGLPGLAIFVAEFAVFVAFFQTHGYWLLLPLVGVVLTAGYHLWALQRIFFGPLHPKTDLGRVDEAPWYETLPLTVIIGLALLFGIAPWLLMDPVTGAVHDLLQLMGVVT